MTITTPTTDPLVRCVKITRPDIGHRYCVYPISQFDLTDEFSGSEPGDTIILQIVDMLQSELDVLPEFDGW